MPNEDLKKDKLESATRRILEMRQNGERGHVTIYVSEGKVPNYEVVEKH